MSSKNVAVGKHNPIMDFSCEYFSPIGHFEFRISIFHGWCQIKDRILRNCRVPGHKLYIFLLKSSVFTTPDRKNINDIVEGDILWWLVVNIARFLVNITLLRLSVKQVGYQVYGEGEYDRGVLLRWYWVQSLERIDVF